MKQVAAFMLKGVEILTVRHNIIENASGVFLKDSLSADKTSMSNDIVNYAQSSGVMLITCGTAPT